jgi:hypothetical protein
LNTENKPNLRTVTRVRRLAGRVAGRGGLARRIGDFAGSSTSIDGSVVVGFSVMGSSAVVVILAPERF